MIGERLSDRYEIVSELGRGGMGVVYRAHDPNLNRDVAIKIIAPEMLTAETEQRFQSEARLVAGMDHPAIVPIYDFGRHEGSLFFVMPVVEGQSLRDCIRQASLTLGAVVEIGVGVAEALDYSHSRGVIHRDIKPENIMVAVADGEVRLRIMDFGLARGNNVSGMTKTGMLMGTLSYISPEQVRGGKVDGRTDIYALGCTLYECLVGDVPFSGDMQSVLYRIVHELPQSPRELGADVDPELDALVLRCLVKDPDDRPADAGELVRGLRGYRARVSDSRKMMSMMATQSLAMPRPALAPFVGRAEELKEIQGRFNAALRGECQFVLVGGTAGAGKTRLLDELERLAEARQVRVLHGRFVEQDGAFPYHGFCEAVQEFFRLRERGSGSSAPPDLSDIAADLVALFPMLSEIPAIRVGSGGDTGPLGDGERTAENRTEIYELLARTLVRLSGGKPLALLLEDLHGADASIEALQYIVRRLGPTPTLIAATYRDTEVDRIHPVSQLLESFRGDRKFVALSLGPLSPEEHVEFLSTLTGGSDVAADLAGKLYEVTEGNPFFTKELVRSMIDAGSMAQDDTGSWSLSGATTISSESLPATIQQAVESRIDRLPGQLRGILAVAAVMGRSFEFDDLEALVEDADNLDDAVDRFIQEGLLEEDRQSRGDRLNFASAIVREVLYGELGRRHRRRLHRKYAQRLEKRQSGKLERVYPQLLYHFSEGDDADKSVEYGLLHGQRALDSFSPEEAVRAARTALEFLDDDWEGDAATEGEARMMLAAGYHLAGDVAAALREFDTAIRVFERVGRADRAVAAMLAAARAAWQVREAEEARRWVERGLDAARASADGEHVADFLSLAATIANLRGDYARGREYLAEAEKLSRRVGDESALEAIPKGGLVTVGLANEIKAATPIDMQLTEDFEVIANVCETLIVTDASGNLRPRLCSDWETRDGGRSFRFVLRSEAHMHDGTRLDAAVAKAAIESAIRRAESTPPPAFTVIEGFEEFAAGDADAIAGLSAHSADTLEIRLSEELPIYPALLSDPRAAIFRTGPDGSGLIGTGPFRLVEHQRTRVLLERNDEYWMGSPPNVDAIEFRAGQSAAALAAGFRDGRFDLSRDLLPEDLESILRDPRFHDCAVEAPQKFTYFVLFNARSGPLAGNVKLRRALASGVRARDLVWRTLGRLAVPAVGLIPPGILGHDPGRRLPVVRPEEAGAAVAEACDGAPPRLRAAVHPLIRDRYGALLAGLLESWRDLGVEVDLVTDDVESYLAAWRDSTGIDLLIMRWQPDFDDPDSCTHILFHSRQGALRTYYSGEEIDALLEGARREARPGMREALYRRFESQLLDGGVLVPLFHDIGYRLASSKLRAVKLGTSTPYVNYAQLGKAEATVTPRSTVAGGTITVPISAEVRMLEPTAIVYAEEGEVQAAIYEPLMRDVGGARIEPWLAADWRVEEAGARYWFRLRDDVRFHDGRRLSARDVRYSLERLLQAQDSPGRPFFSPIRGAAEVIAGQAQHLSGFRILSTHEFSIELATGVSFFPVLLASLFSVILPEGTGTIGTSIQEGAVGTGPFQVASFAPGRRLELERNPTYWRRGYPKSDRLIFDLSIGPGEAAAGFREGRYSLASDLFPADAEALRRDPKYRAGYQETPQLSSHFVVFNVHRGPLSDLATRRRVAAAIDAPRLVRQVLGRQALPAAGLIPPDLLGHDVRRPAPTPTVAPVGAEGGEELRLSLAVAPVYGGEYSPFLRALREELAGQGILLDQREPTMEAYTNALREGSTDMVIGRWVADYPDADTFAYTLYTAAGNIGRYVGTPEGDALIDAARAEVNPAARHAIYARIEHLIVRDTLLIPTFHDQVYRFARPEIEGVKLSYWAPSVAYENLRVRAAGARG